MSAVIADLHVHTTRSDGTISPDAVGALAADSGLHSVAITDHERLPPFQTRIVDGVTVIAGIELRVEPPETGRVDLLGYGVDPTPQLRTLLERIQAERIDRATAMRDRLEQALGIDLDIDIGPGIGRPTLARAVAAATSMTVDEVFEDFIGEGRPCYVKRSVPSFERGRAILATASEAVVLAHPGRYDDVRGALDLVDHLDGLEYWYPYASPDRTDQVDRYVDRAENLLLTGGSDAHAASAVGSAGLSVSAYRPVAERLGLAMD